MVRVEVGVRHVGDTDRVTGGGVFDGVVGVAGGEELRAGFGVVVGVGVEGGGGGVVAEAHGFVRGEVLRLWVVDCCCGVICTAGGCLFRLEIRCPWLGAGVTILTWS